MSLAPLLIQCHPEGRMTLPHGSPRCCLVRHLTLSQHGDRLSTSPTDSITGGWGNQMGSGRPTEQLHISAACDQGAHLSLVRWPCPLICPANCVQVDREFGLREGVQPLASRTLRRSSYTEVHTAPPSLPRSFPPSFPRSFPPSLPPELMLPPPCCSCQLWGNCGRG